MLKYFPWDDNFISLAHAFVFELLLFTEDEHTMEVPLDTCQEIYRYIHEKYT